MNHEKEQEMISTVGQNDATPKITLSEFSTQKELMEKELEARAKREWSENNAWDKTSEKIG